MISDKSIICFGGEDWWYHHPHSKNHLMRLFARAGNRVIFVNSISMGLASIANKDFLAKILRKLKSYSKLARTTEEGITVVSPASIPFFGSRLSRGINRLLLSSQIGVLARVKGLNRPILWIAIPTAVDMIGRFNEGLVIYQVSDKYDENDMDHATDKSLIRELHNRALESADIILYSGRKLLAEATVALDRSWLLEQAVDFPHWSSVSSGTLKVAPRIQEIPQPRIGYFGAIEPWLVDQQLIRKALKEHPDWHWVFIGNKARGLDIEGLPNVHFPGAVPYQELPNYAAGFDVCVLPWKAEHVFTSYGSAIKVREYLATGLPVVIAPLPEYEPMKDVLRIGRTREEFLTLVDDALKENDPAAVKKRQDAVASGTWTARAEWLSNLIEEKLSEKARSGK